MKTLISVLFLLISFSASAQNPGNVLSIGDSLTAGLAGSSSGVLTCAALGGAQVASDQQRSCKGNGQRNIGGWQPALSSLSGVSVFNYGNSGELSSEILARTDFTMNASNSQFVLILAGTNDAIRGPSVSQVLVNLESMINQVRLRGRIPIVGTLPPLLGGRFAGYNAKVVQINQLIRLIEDVEVADHYAALLPKWAENTSGDFIHLGPSGNALVASTWADAISRSLEQPSRPPLTGVNSLFL